jgi:hypothetical protein
MILRRAFSGEPVVPARHRQAGRQPLDVPLERPGQRFVEIVDVEDQPPLRRGERPEIGQVRIPAQLHLKPRGRRAGQIRRHRQRRPPVKRERRHQHPPMPHRHQLRHTALGLPQQQPHRVPRLARRELRMRLQRSQRPGILPPRHPVRMAQLFHDLTPRLGPGEKPTHQVCFPPRHQPSQSWPLPPGAIAWHRRSAGATERSSLLVPDEHLQARLASP